MKIISLFWSTTRVVAFFLFIIFQTRCLQVEEKPVNFGPEINATEVIKTVREPLGSMNHNEIGKNEKSEKTLWAAIRNNEPVLLGVSLKEVVDKKELPDRVQYFSRVTNTIFENGKPKTTISEPDPNNPSDEFPQTQAFEIEQALSETLMTLGGAQFTDNIKTTFHGLTYKDVVIEAPQKVKNKGNCVFSPSCQLKARVVNVIAVEWLPSGPKRHDLEFVVSPQVPFFSKILAQCDTSLRNIEGRQYPVTACTTITDFDFGTSW